MSILPQDEAAAIMNHYFAQLARAAGLRWSERNRQDIEHACELLSGAEEAAGDEIPPYERPIVSDRVTEVFERDPVEAAAHEARLVRQRWAEADDVPVRRMIRREGGAR